MIATFPLLKILYLWVGSIWTQIGLLVIILPNLQSFLTAAESKWSFKVLPVFEYKAASPTPLAIPKYLNAASEPEGTIELQLGRVRVKGKIIIIFFMFNFKSSSPNNLLTSYQHIFDLTNKILVLYVIFHIYYILCYGIILQVKNVKKN